MKKMLAILLALIMVFTLVACSVDGETEDSKKAEDAAPAADAEATPDAEEEKAEDASSKPEATASSEDIFVRNDAGKVQSGWLRVFCYKRQRRCGAAVYRY